MELFSLLRSLGRAALLLSVVTLVHCDKANCEQLRDELYDQKLTWQACKSSSDCLMIGGNPSDCTGILSCNLAINRHYTKEAERRIASLPEETVECHKCGTPNCPNGEIPYCEPVLNRCIVVTDFLGDGGAASMGFTPGTGARGSGGSSTGGDAGSASGGSGGSGGLATDPNQPVPPP